MRKALIVDAAAKPGGHYSHAVIANGFVYVSGQGPDRCARRCATCRPFWKARARA